MEFGAGDENVEMLLIDEENWQTDKGNPVRLCSQGESDRRLVVYGNRSWYETSRSDTLAPEGGQENRQTERGNPLRFCSQGESERRLVAFGNGSWYETSGSDTLAPEGGKLVESTNQEFLLALLALLSLLVVFVWLSCCQCEMKSETSNLPVIKKNIVE